MFNELLSPVDSLISSPDKRVSNNDVEIHVYLVVYVGGTYFHCDRRDYYCSPSILASETEAKHKMLRYVDASIVTTCVGSKLPMQECCSIAAMYFSNVGLHVVATECCGVEHIQTVGVVCVSSGEVT